MPVHDYPACPRCKATLIRKPGGCCPSCGADVRAFVAGERDRETRIERVVAVISTFLVVSVLVFGGGFGLIEGVLMYAAAGAFVWYLAKGTFGGAREASSSSETTSGETPSTR